MNEKTKGKLAPPICLNCGGDKRECRWNSCQGKLTSSIILPEGVHMRESGKLVKQSVECEVCSYPFRYCSCAAGPTNKQFKEKRDKQQAFEMQNGPPATWSVKRGKIVDFTGHCISADKILEYIKTIRVELE